MDAPMTFDLNALKSSAATGDVRAMTALGKQLISAPSSAQDAQDGQMHLKAALDAGDGEAATFIGVMLASGMTGEPNWSVALDYLALAASRGCAPAVEQLAVLAGAEGDAKSLRAQIDLNALLAIPEKHSLCEAPRIRRFDGFLTAPMCEYLIRTSQPKLTRAKVYDDADMDGKESLDRTNSEVSFGLLDLDLILLLAQTKISAITSVPLFAMEKSKVLHYEAGQTFAPHFDFLEPSKPAQAADMKRFGQRLATCLIYLNADFDGGETDFPTLGQRYKCDTGGALLFANVNEQGRPDPTTLHACLPPTRGEKWLFSQWIRSGPMG